MTHVMVREHIRKNRKYKPTAQQLIKELVLEDEEVEKAKQRVVIPMRDSKEPTLQSPASTTVVPPIASRDEDVNASLASADIRKSAIPSSKSSFVDQWAICQEVGYFVILWDTL